MMESAEESVTDIARRITKLKWQWVWYKNNQLPWGGKVIE